MLLDVPSDHWSCATITQTLANDKPKTVQTQQLNRASQINDLRCFVYCHWTVCFVYAFICHITGTHHIIGTATKQVGTGTRNWNCSISQRNPVVWNMTVELSGCLLCNDQKLTTTFTTCLYVINTCCSDYFNHQVRNCGNISLVSLWAGLYHHLIQW